VSELTLKLLAKSKLCLNEWSAFKQCTHINHHEKAESKFFDYLLQSKSFRLLTDEKKLLKSKKSHASLLYLNKLYLSIAHLESLNISQISSQNMTLKPLFEYLLYVAVFQR
jgi:hypothetical protein